MVANSHPHWQAELARLEPRLGHNKAIVAIARKLLGFAYRVGKENRPAGQTAAQFVRVRLDALHLGGELTHISWGSKKPIPLPRSSLKTERSDVPNTK